MNIPNIPLISLRPAHKTGHLVAALAVFALALAHPPPLNAATPPHAAANLPKVEINRGFSELVRAVKPAVVNISTTGRARPGPDFRRQLPELEEFFHRFFGQPPQGFPRTPGRPPQAPRERRTTAVGSGFVIAPEGLVVTNHHVIEGADEIEVVFDDGTRRPATLRGRDPKTDLALLQVDADKPLPYVKFGDSDKARVGDWIIAIGNPFGLGGTTTSGIISARGRDIQAGPLDDFIQIDAPINRGNSGGPLFNVKGEVIGVNSAIYSPNGGNVGIGFAIPSAVAGDVIAQLRETGVVRHGFLGVHIQAVNEEISESLGMKKAAGALVTQVSPDSPAEQAGIQVGDVILSYDGKAIRLTRDLPKLVARTGKGAKVAIEVWRNERRKTLRATIGSSEPEDAVTDLSGATSESGGLGLSVGALDAENRKQYGIAADADGALVITVDPTGAAAGLGVRVGELITHVGSKPVKSPAEVKDAVQAARKAGKESVLLLIERGGQTRFVPVPMT